MRSIGDRAVDSLRLEKAYGIWSTEFRQDYTPGMSGLDRFVAFDKGGFIGADAARRERDDPPSRVLALLDVDATDADASTDEGIWIGERQVGVVTSGAYGHHVGKSLALAYVDREIVDARIRAHGARRRRGTNRADPARASLRSERQQAPRTRLDSGTWASRRLA